MQLSGTYDNLSDAELDDLYSSTFDSYQTSTGAAQIAWATSMQLQSMDILDRLSSVTSFITGFFGSSKFPKYDAIQKTHPNLKGFQQVTTAQTSVKTAAGNVVDTMTSGLKWGLGGTAVVGVGLIALYIYVNRRK